MLKTKITDLLEIKYPIVGGAMMWISKAEFVAAMSEAGGLGIMASANYKSKESFSEAIEKMKTLTNNPYGININLFPAMTQIDNNDYIDVMADNGLKIVETSGHHAPEELIARFKDLGMTWIHKCVGVRYAKKVEAMGADIVTVVGYENGGATGRLDTCTMVLVPVVVDAVNVPVIGGGGISDGRGVAAVLSLGAEAVIMGTRLLVTKESPIHDNIKNALLNASELDTMLVMRSLNATHRVLNNDAANQCVELENKKAEFAELYEVIKGENANEMYYKGIVGKGILSCGQGIGLAHDIPSVKELFDRMAEKAEQTLMRFSN
ncbi:MAG: nitronate monooxygenase family protein [Desulfobacteraceae bacterium]|jgi:NAD(P)H-dependent flavin oxidoreductase YrpB (nitropropane dioxygenase family)|nr:nitronate monooxygenase family protein [Desulfobacteraceae bacterium]